MRSNIAIKYRWWITGFAVLITVLIAFPLKNARINPNLMDYLPEDIVSKLNMEKLEDIFGKNDPILIIIESQDILSDSTLKRVRNLNNELKSMHHAFNNVISLFELKYIQRHQNMMVVDPAVKSIPSNENERELLRKQIADNPLVYNILISKDFKHTLIILKPEENISDVEIFTLIRETLIRVPGNEKVYLNGLPYLRDEIQKIATRDLALLFPVGLIVMLIFLYISFKEIKAVLLPFSVVIMAVILATGLMPLLKFDFSLIAVLIPIMLIAIANNYGIHIISRYQELNALYPEKDMRQITHEVISFLKKPVILAALTTIIGILGLVLHIMLPARQMGIVTSAGIGFALLLSLFFIPALLSGMKKGEPHNRFKGEKLTLIDTLLSRTGKKITRYPLSVVYIFIGLIIISAFGISKLEVSINMEEMMPDSHPIRESTHIANDKFGGTKNISILFEGDIKDPEVMQTMDRFESELKGLPGIGNVFSLATIIRAISRALNDPGDKFYDTIPDNREAIAQYIELYSMSGDPEDFEEMVDFNYTKAILIVNFKAENISAFNQISGTINQLVNSSPFASLAAGQSLIEKEMSELIIRGQLYSLAFALVAIIILIWLIFKSYIAGIMAGIPLLLTLICNFGLMGMMGFKLDIATSLLSSVAIGIGIDYTIHLLWRLKYELSEGRKYKDAIILTLRTTGRSIAINAFSVIIGFAVLFLSGLTILKAFALLIIFSLLICLLSAIILVPAICLIFKPAFLKNNTKK